MTFDLDESDRDIARMQVLAARRPSIGDDGDVVLSADAVFGDLPIGTDEFHLVSLIAHGYVWFDDDYRHRYQLTDTGMALRDRWAEIRRGTTAAARPYGSLTEPSPREIQDNAHPDGPSLLWSRQRPTH